jgi:hypothetical protein
MHKISIWASRLYNFLQFFFFPPCFLFCSSSLSIRRSLFVSFFFLIFCYLRQYPSTLLFRCVCGVAIDGPLNLLSRNQFHHGVHYCSECTLVQSWCQWNTIAKSFISQSFPFQSVEKLVMWLENSAINRAKRIRRKAISLAVFSSFSGPYSGFSRMKETHVSVVQVRKLRSFYQHGRELWVKRITVVFMEAHEIIRTCNKHRGNEKYIQNFAHKSLKNRIFERHRHRWKDAKV